MIAWETTCEATVTLILDGTTQTATCDDDRLNTPSRPVDFAVAGGAGVQLALTGAIHLSVELLYTHGVRSIYAGELDRTSHNRAGSVRAGLVFPIRG